MDNKIKVFYEDGTYTTTNPFIVEIKLNQLKNKELPRGLYKLQNKISPLLYQEELEWYEVKHTLEDGVHKNKLHFIGYVTDLNIIDKICPL